MAVAGEVAINLVARIDALEKNLKRGRQKVKEFGDETRGVLDQLKHGLGGRSDFKEFFELLKGTGAIAGLNIAAETLRDMSASAIKLRDALFNAEKSAGQVAEDFIKTIPVIGKLFEAGRNIRELITGEQLYIDTVTKGAEKVTDLINRQNEVRREGIAIQKEFGTAIGKAQTDREIANAKPPFRDWLKAQREFVQGMDSAKKMYGDSLDEIFKKAGMDSKQIKTRQQELIRDLEANQAAEQRTISARKQGVGVYGGDAVLAAQRARREELNQINQLVIQIEKAWADLDRSFNRLQFENVKTLGSNFFQFGEDLGKKITEGIQTRIKTMAWIEDFGKELMRRGSRIVSFALFSSPSGDKKSDEAFADRAAAAAQKLRDRLSEAAAAYKQLMTTPSSQLLDTARQLGTLLASGGINPYQYAIAFGKMAGQQGSQVDAPRTSSAREFRAGNSMAIPDSSASKIDRLVKATEEQTRILSDIGRNVNPSTSPTPPLFDYGR